MTHLFVSRNDELIESIFAVDELTDDDKLYNDYLYFIKNLGFSSDFVCPDKLISNLIIKKSLKTINSKGHFTTATAIKKCKFVTSNHFLDRRAGRSQNEILGLILFSISKSDIRKISFGSIISTFAYFFQNRLADLATTSTYRKMRIFVFYNKNKVENGDLIFSILFFFTFLGIERTSTINELLINSEESLKNYLSVINKYKDFFNTINNDYCLKAQKSYKIGGFLMIVKNSINIVNSLPQFKDFLEVDIQFSFRS